MSDGGQSEKKTQSEHAITTTATVATTTDRSNRASGDEFGRAVSKMAMAQICKSVGFESANESALESLSDLAVKYLRDFAKAAKFHANLAGRTDSNVFDVMQGLEDLGFSGVSEIVEYVDSAEEIPFAQPLPHFPVVKERISIGIPSFLQMDETPEFKHIPDWLPAFPDPHTYRTTPVWNERVTDPRADKIEFARQRRKAERSLLSLQQRLVGNGAAEDSSSAEPDEGGESVEANGSENPFLSEPLQPEEGRERVEVNGSENPFPSESLPAGEKEVSPVVLPARISSSDVNNENLATLLETFAPAIEAMKDEVSESENGVKKSLPEKRPALCLEFRTGKKVLGETLDLRLRNKGSGKTAAWFGRDDDKDDKKRRVEYILRQSMENQQDLAQL